MRLHLAWKWPQAALQKPFPDIFLDLIQQIAVSVINPASELL